jgi:ABC-type transport system substrate-binding protein
MPTRRTIAALLFTLLPALAAAPAAVAATGAAVRAEAPAAGGAKVLHMFLSTSETGLDPAVGSDLATLSLLENLFDPLLRYDYLARPVKLQGNTATALPAIEDGGRSYTFHIRPGIYFTPDPAFKAR